MNKESFSFILREINNHEIFQNNSLNPQREVWVQLVVALERFGCDGNGISVGRVARSIGIGNGTVTLYTRRVVNALLSLEGKFIKWPSSRRRREISSQILEEYGIPNVVGIIDGTHIHFSQRPAIDGEVYWTRKSRYSINAQIVCDNDKRIIYYQVGWPGSVIDQTAFEQTNLFKYPNMFLNVTEFLLGDSGYSSSEKMLTPYRNPLAQVPVNSAFNFHFSRCRVKIEHVMGLLKARWSSLRGIRTQIKVKEDLAYVNQMVKVIFILHNIMINLNDEWVVEDDMDLFAANAELANIPAGGYNLRESIK
jgi:hypothetical protein